MSYQVCYTFSDDEIDELCDLHDIDSIADLREMMKTVGKEAMFLKSVVNEIMDEQGDAQ